MQSSSSGNGGGDDDDDGGGIGTTAAGDDLTSAVANFTLVYGFSPMPAATLLMGGRSGRGGASGYGGSDSMMGGDDSRSSSSDVGVGGYGGGGGKNLDKASTALPVVRQAVGDQNCASEEEGRHNDKRELLESMTAERGGGGLESSSRCV
jgi:hypothetical protein